MDEDQLGRLPKYAQQEIKRLRDQNVHLQERLTSVQSGESRISYRIFGTRIFGWIAEDSVIDFAFGAQNFVTIRLAGDRLNVLGSRAFSIVPLAANVIEIVPRGQ